MKLDLKGIIDASIDEAIEETLIKTKVLALLDAPKREEFGDFSTNVAMLIAPKEGRPAKEIAEILASKISSSPLISRCEVKGPGFINIFLNKDYWYELLKDVLEKGLAYGDIFIGGGKKVLIEFVSANPTGPLHIGHGRGAAVGDALSNLLKTAGFEVTKEYYVNDAGAQAYILGESVKLREKELRGEKVEFPPDYYKGEYVRDLAKEFDEMIPLGKAARIGTHQEFAVNKMLECIKKDLSDFGVVFDSWQSERELGSKITDSTEELRKKGLTYESEGALWFRTTDFGDDKDRVLIKADGQLTYFASDIAYHLDKIKRGYDTIVDVWGADHHGYEARVRAVFKAFGHDPEMLKIIFIQLVSLKRGAIPVPMGKREGEFVTLRQVMDEVGTDATRFFFLMRKSDSHLEFDLELAKKQAPENPVYYVQYAYARISSIMAFAKEMGIEIPPPSAKLLKRLSEKQEIGLIKHIALFEGFVEKSALDMEPHRITSYLQEIAGLFHPYYNSTRVVVEDKELTKTRLLLCKAVGNVVKKGLSILGVRAPEKM